MDSSPRFGGSIPQNYDHGLGPTVFVDYASDIATRAAALRPMRVLETAAGTGIVSRALRDALAAETMLTSTDLSPQMLEVARAKFTPEERIVFQPADATALPFEDASFDVVVCQFGVMFYPDKDLGYREVSRVLVPGGHYLFSVWDSHRNNPYSRIAHQVLGTFFPVDPPQFQRVPFSYPFEAIKDSLGDAGFTDITVNVLKILKEVPDPMRFAKGIIQGNPTIDQIRQRGGVDPDDVQGAIVKIYEEEFGTAPMRIPLQALVISARKPD